MSEQELEKTLKQESWEMPEQELEKRGTRIREEVEVGAKVG